MFSRSPKQTQRWDIISGQCRCLELRTGWLSWDQGDLKSSESSNKVCGSHAHYQLGDCIVALGKAVRSLAQRGFLATHRAVVGGGRSHGRRGYSKGHSSWERSSVFRKVCGPSKGLNYESGAGPMPIVQLRHIVYGLGQTEGCLWLSRRGQAWRWWRRGRRTNIDY